MRTLLSQVISKEEQGIILTLRNGVFLERLFVPHLVKFSAFYGTGKFIASIYKSPPLLPILIQINPFQPPTPFYFFKIYFNIILLSTPRLSKWIIFFSLFHQTSVCSSHLPTTCHRPIPSHFSWFDSAKNIWLKDTQMSKSFSLSSHLQSYVTSSVLVPNGFLSTVFSKTLSLCSFINMTDQVSQPHEKQEKLYLCERYMKILRWAQKSRKNIYE